MLNFIYTRSGLVTVRTDSVINEQIVALSAPLTLRSSPTKPHNVKTTTTVSFGKTAYLISDFEVDSFCNSTNSTEYRQFLVLQPLDVGAL